MEHREKGWIQCRQKWKQIADAPERGNKKSYGAFFRWGNQ